MFYKTSSGLCNPECGCGEGQVKNYRDPSTGATYDACVPGELCIETVKIQVLIIHEQHSTNSSE